MATVCKTLIYSSVAYLLLYKVFLHSIVGSLITDDNLDSIFFLKCPSRPCQRADKTELATHSLPLILGALQERSLKETMGGGNADLFLLKLN